MNVQTMLHFMEIQPYRTCQHILDEARKIIKYSEMTKFYRLEINNF